MKKSLKVIFLIALVFAFCIPLVSNAAIADTEQVESYKKWEKLSDKEKLNSYQPLPFSVKYDYNLSLDLFQGSELQLVSGLKASYQERYQIENLEVRNQEDTMQCWAFSTSTLLESNVEKLTNTVAPLYSPRHMDYATTYTFLDGVNEKGYKRELREGGNAFLGMGYYTSGLGPVLETDMPFKNEETKINLSEIQNKEVVKKVDDYKVYPSIYKEINSGMVTYYNGYKAGSPYRVEYTETQINEVRNQIKSHILQYGAISSCTYAGEYSLPFFNIDKAQNEGKEFAYYCDSNSYFADHAITIVGWDDNYSRENFNSEHMPSRDGAYIVLNSYGEELFNNGYYYVSYDDVFIETSLIGIVKSSDVLYDHIYQYDELGYSFTYFPTTTSGETFQAICAANVFQRDSSVAEELTEVSFYINETSNVKLYINPKDDDIASAAGIKDLKVLTPGYHTVKLDEPIKLTGRKFAVALIFENTDSFVGVPLELNYNSNEIGSNFWDTAKGNKGESFISSNGRDWHDLTALGIKDANICIKAFTKENAEEEVVPVTSVSLNLQESKMNVGDSLSLKATVSPTNATNKNVNWTSSNEAVATVSSSGVVKAISAGEATITATTEDGAKVASCKITVLAAAEEILVTKISIDTISLTTYVGKTEQVTATVFPEHATDKTLVWKSNDTSVATVDNTGKVKGVGQGKTTITVTNERSKVSESFVVTVLKTNSNDEDGTNTNTNSNTTNTNTNTNSGNNTISTPGNTTVSNSSKDDTISPEKLPATGKEIITKILIFLVVTTLVVVIKKNYDLRDI